MQTNKSLGFCFNLKRGWHLICNDVLTKVKLHNSLKLASIILNEISNYQVMIKKKLYTNTVIIKNGNKIKVINYKKV